MDLQRLFAVGVILRFPQCPGTVTELQPAPWGFRRIKKGGRGPLSKTYHFDLEPDSELHTVGSRVIPVPAGGDAANRLVVELPLVRQVLAIHREAISVI